jgi:hypothetical protein
MAGPEYVPLSFSGIQWSCVAGAAITAGQLVAITGGTLSGGGVVPTVAPTTAATASEVGVAAFSAATGAPVSVYFGGLHVLSASGAITAGDPVVAAASGAVADVSTDTTYDQVIGKAWSTVSSGQVVVRLAEV